MEFTSIDQQILQDSSFCRLPLLAKTNKNDRNNRKKHPNTFQKLQAQIFSER
jgi:hypothetical protein